ncbi:MAG: hypothetical protein JWR09_5416, partial [Mucilaginibacter sp.]|nr:hypothetical protein [Mucilaginibacter sp.]
MFLYETRYSWLFFILINVRFIFDNDFIDW